MDVGAKSRPREYLKVHRKGKKSNRSSKHSSKRGSIASDRRGSFQKPNISASQFRTQREANIQQNELQRDTLQTQASDTSRNLKNSKTNFTRPNNRQSLNITFDPSNKINRQKASPQQGSGIQLDKRVKSIQEFGFSRQTKSPALDRMSEAQDSIGRQSKKQRNLTINV